MRARGPASQPSLDPGLGFAPAGPTPRSRPFPRMPAVWFEEKLIYYPVRHPEGLYAASSRPGGPRDVDLVAEDGVRLHAWLREPAAPVATFLFCHGNAGNLTHRLDILERLAAAGIRTFIFDYRGYGRSEGKPGEEGLYRDARAAYDRLAAEPGVEPGRIFAYGESLGGAVAAQLTLDRPCAGVILQSTFRSLRAIGRETFPVLHLLARHRFETEAKLARIAAPVLVVHGEADTLIGPHHARRLHEAAREPKWLHLVPRADHNDLWEVGGRDLVLRLRRFATEDAARPVARA